MKKDLLPPKSTHTPPTTTKKRTPRERKESQKTKMLVVVTQFAFAFSLCGRTHTRCVPQKLKRHGPAWTRSSSSPSVHFPFLPSGHVREPPSPPPKTTHDPPPRRHHFPGSFRKGPWLFWGQNQGVVVVVLNPFFFSPPAGDQRSTRLALRVMSSYRVTTQVRPQRKGCTLFPFDRPFFFRNPLVVCCCPCPPRLTQPTHPPNQISTYRPFVSELNAMAR